MSYRTGHHSEYPQHHPHDHGRTSARRPAASHAVAASAQAQNGYTIVHAGKQVRFGPVVFWIVVGTVTVLGMWSAATATYFAFRDDVLTRLIARQAEMQYAYEDRIAELRAKVDRTTSRQMIDQEQFDKKLDQIMRRESDAGIARHRARRDARRHRIDPAVGAQRRRSERNAGLRHTKTQPDQRHRDFRGAAGSRGAARIARARRRQRARQPSSPRPAASTTFWCACRARSTRSRAGSSRCSIRSKTAWNRGCAACAA